MRALGLGSAVVAFALTVAFGLPALPVAGALSLPLLLGVVIARTRVRLPPPRWRHEVLITAAYVALAVVIVFLLDPAAATSELSAIVLATVALGFLVPRPVTIAMPGLVLFAVLVAFGAFSGCTGCDQNDALVVFLGGAGTLIAAVLVEVGMLVRILVERRARARNER